MHKALLCLFFVLTSFTLFSQEQGLGADIRASTSLSFGSVTISQKYVYHPFARIGSTLFVEDKKDSFVLGDESRISDEIKTAKAAADNLSWDTDQIVYKKVNFDCFNPYGYGSSLWVFGRTGLQFGVRYYYGGMTLVGEQVYDQPNAYQKNGFLPSGDRRYGNMYFLMDVDLAIIPELSLDMIKGLPVSRAAVAGESYVPISKRAVEEDFNLISFAHDGQGFDFTIYPQDKEYALQILKEKIFDPTLKQIQIEAMRQKLIEYYKWAISLPSTVSMLKRAGFILYYNINSTALPVDANFVYNWVREVAERKLTNSSGLKTEIAQMQTQQNIDKKSLYWPDFYLGVTGSSSYSISSGSYDLFSSPMLDIGFGYNFGKSFIYLDGAVGGNSSSLLYSGNVRTNFRFVDFFELNTVASYDQSGAAKVSSMPNFILFNILQLGGIIYVDVLPAVGIGLGARVGFGEALDFQVKYDTKTLATSFSAGLRF